MTPTTQSANSELKVKQCDRCHVREGSSHPIGNYTVSLKSVSLNETEQLFCSRCRLRAEIKAKKSSITDRSILFSLKQWWKVKRK